MNVPVLAVVLISGALSTLLTGAVRTYALRHGVLDRPNARSSHGIATPRGGGTAVIASAAAGMLIAVQLGLVRPFDASVLGAGMIVLGIVGWVDDRRGLGPGVRLSVHLAVAGSTVYMLRGLPELALGTAVIRLGPAGYVLATIGLVWSINLFNFMDGIDGLAGSEAVLCFGTAALLLAWAGDLSLGAIAASVSASSAGFLVWNWAPARIFLGDVGSGALGYLIGAIAIASENRHEVPLLAIAIVYGIFLCDATITLLRRLRRGERPAEAHRNHAYQRVTRTWNSHALVAAGAAAVTAVLAGLAAIGTIQPHLMVLALLLAALLLGAVLILSERIAPM